MPTLDWLNRAEALKIADAVPYRLLEHVSSHGDISQGNLLIQGDNLDALKALLPMYRGRVKCIYIDPPYNTKSAFEHYNDNLEHSQWLSMMHPRLVLLREFLSEEGSLWVSIDDNEGHYLKVLMDEIFGRKNFIATFVWERDKGGRGDADVSVSHDYILAYALNKDVWVKIRNLIDRTTVQLGRFKNPDDDPRGPWRQGDDGTAKSGTDKQRFPITLPSGRVVVPKVGRFWAFSKQTFDEAVTEGRAYFGKDGDRLPIIKRYLSEVREGVAPRTWWPAEEAGTNQSAKRDHLRKLLPDLDPFATPKPEELLSRIIHISSNEGDVVFDSFLGSGTSAAVAHKMGRRYIGIEMGNHAVTHCLPRLEKVIAGEQGGISEVVSWKGGGGFQFLKLGEPVFDESGTINPKVRFGTLAHFIWLQDTGTVSSKRFQKPLLGVHNGTAYYLLFNGILGDKRPQGGNVLSGAVLDMLRKQYPHDGPKVVYGEGCGLGPARLEAAGITFKHIPYDVKAR